jgi:hypothetical protein
MVKATDEWLDKYKAPCSYLRKEGKRVENYISYEKYQELKAVFEEYKEIDIEIIYKPAKKTKKDDKRQNKELFITFI